MKNEIGARGSRRALFLLAGCLLSFLPAAGCQSTEGNVGRVQSYPLASVEAAWIRNGEPIEFEGRSWYPSDGVENFLDSEMDLLGEYRGVQFFADKVDIRPYERLYTKFGRNKFRFFEKRAGPDKFGSQNNQTQRKS